MLHAAALHQEALASHPGLAHASTCSLSEASTSHPPDASEAGPQRLLLLFYADTTWEACLLQSPCSITAPSLLGPHPIPAVPMPGAPTVIQPAMHRGSAGPFSSEEGPAEAAPSTGGAGAAWQDGGVAAELAEGLPTAAVGGEESMELEVPGAPRFEGYEQAGPRGPADGGNAVVREAAGSEARQMGGTAGLVAGNMLRTGSWEAQAQATTGRQGHPLPAAASPAEGAMQAWRSSLAPPLVGEHPSSSRRAPAATTTQPGPSPRASGSSPWGGMPQPSGSSSVQQDCCHCTNSPPQMGSGSEQGCHIDAPQPQQAASGAGLRPSVDDPQQPGGSTQTLPELTRLQPQPVTQPATQELPSPHVPLIHHALPHHASGTVVVVESVEVRSQLEEKMVESQQQRQQQQEMKAVELATFCCRSALLPPRQRQQEMEAEVGQQQMLALLLPQHREFSPPRVRQGGGGVLRGGPEITPLQSDVEVCS